MQSVISQVITPFSGAEQQDIRDHVEEVRRLYDWPGVRYHHSDQPHEKGFNRWAYHNPPVLMHYHHRLIQTAVDIFGCPLKPSYCFLSMYGHNGICPEHTDRPQCWATLDYLVSTDAQKRLWPLYVAEECTHEGNKKKFKKVILGPGQAVGYSGLNQAHYRKFMHEDSDATYANLVFFHFVPIAFNEPLS